MKLNELKPAAGSSEKAWRKGRGPGSGNKGPPKRGFTNDMFKKVYAIINVADLDRFEEGTEVTVETLIAEGIIKDVKSGVKVLGNGEITKKLTVKANVFSASAKEKIEAAGGKTEVI